MVVCVRGGVEALTGLPGCVPWSHSKIRYAKALSASSHSSRCRKPAWVTSSHGIYVPILVF